VAGLGAVAAGFLLPPRYRASVLLGVEWRDSDEALLRQRGIDVASRRGQAVRERATEPGLLEAVVREARPYGRGRPLDEQVEKVLADLRVRSLSPGTVEIELAHSEPSTAALVANRIAASLVAASGSAGAAPAAALVGDMRGLEGRLAEARQLLEQKAAALTGERPAARADTRQALAEHEQAREAYQRLLEEWRLAHTAMPQSGGPAMRLELLRAASVPLAPESAGPVTFGLTGALSGLLLGLVAALVAEHRDRSVKGPEDLASILPVPLLATLEEVRLRGKGRD
jgi:capsular polysaccharide biosynthesis protein